MPEEALLEYCSPTLAGIKTANLMNIPFPDQSTAEQAVLEMEEILAEKGICVKLFQYARGRALIYLYRPHLLLQDFASDEVREFMMSIGYTQIDPEQCLEVLGNRIRSDARFPHEIGVFLGYPIEDVKGFIHHRDKDCKWTGLWRVYGDVEHAKRTVRKYDNCTRIFWENWDRGKRVKDLAVKTY